MTNNGINVLNKNFCFSKVLRDFDSKLKFGKLREGNSLYILNQMKKKNREKLYILQRKYNHNEILFNLKKAYEDNKFLLELKGKKVEDENKTNIEKLPKITNDSKNVLNNNIKDNTNDLIIKDYKNKKQDENFETTWKEELFKKLKENKSINIYSNINVEDELNNKNNIFDKNFKKKEKSKILEKIRRIQRIKENNLRVKSKLNNYKVMMDKFSERKEYTPNYTCLEKHVPIIKLDTNSKRIFPDKFIKLNNYTNDKLIFKKKILKNKSIQNFNRNNFINPCFLFKSESNFNKSIQDDNTIYNFISKSMKNKNNKNDSFLNQFLSKGNSMILIGNI